MVSFPRREQFGIALCELVRSSECRFCSQADPIGRRFLIKTGSYTQLEHKVAENEWEPCDDQRVPGQGSILP